MTLLELMEWVRILLKNDSLEFCGLDGRSIAQQWHSWVRSWPETRPKVNFLRRCNSVNELKWKPAVDINVMSRPWFTAVICTRDFGFFWKSKMRPLERAWGFESIVFRLHHDHVLQVKSGDVCYSCCQVLWLGGLVSSTVTVLESLYRKQALTCAPIKCSTKSCNNVDDVDSWRYFSSDH